MPRTRPCSATSSDIYQPSSSLTWTSWHRCHVAAILPQRLSTKSTIEDFDGVENHPWTDLGQGAILFQDLIVPEPHFAVHNGKRVNMVKEWLRLGMVVGDCEDASDPC